MFVLLNGILNGHLAIFPATLKTGKMQKIKERFDKVLQKRKKCLI